MPDLRLSLPAKKLSLRGTALWSNSSSSSKSNSPLTDQVVGKRLDQASSLYSQLVPTLVVHLGSLSIGLSTALPTILAPPVQQASSNSTSRESNWEPSLWSIQIHLAGAVLGGLLSALLGSTIGRRSSLLVSTLPDMLGWLLMAATYLAPPSASLPLLLTGRALTGLASAGYLSSGQIFVAESVQTEHRGWLAGLALPLGSMGVMLMYVLGSWLSWSHSAAASAAFPIVLAASLVFLNDTPYSLFMQGREKQAHAAMEKLRSGDPAAMAEVFHIQESVERDHVEGGLFQKLKLFCTNKKYFSPFFILNFLIVLILATGVSTMNVYANEMFQRAGGHMNRYLSNIIIGLLQLVGSCLFLPLVKIYSRKQLFASSAITMAVSLSLLGLYLYSQTRYEQFFVAVASSNWLAILCFSAYLLAAPAGLCSVPLLYTAELFPTELRGLLSGLTVSFAASATLVTHLLFPVVERALLPHGMVWLSAAACVAALLLVLACIPETRHKELGDIPAKFAMWRKEKRASPWVTPVHTPATTPSHSRCTTPHREIKKLDFKTQMFTK